MRCPERYTWLGEPVRCMLERAHDRRTMHVAERPREGRDALVIFW